MISILSLGSLPHRHGKWVFAPAWADWAAQFLCWLDDKLTPHFSYWAFRLLDRYCGCERCLERRVKGLQ